MANNKKKLFILLGVLVVVAIIIVVAATQGQKNVPAPSTNEVEQTPTEENAPALEEPGLTEEEINPVLKDSTVVIPGANPITKDNKVVTSEGKETKNDVTPMSPEAPQQTAPVAKEELSKEVLQLGVSASGWNPAEFTVKKGEAVSLAITSTDTFTHVFKFDDPSLSAVAVGVGPAETRAISFNAPTQAGEYTFRCDVPGHAGRGEVGKMIVK